MYAKLDILVCQVKSHVLDLYVSQGLRAPVWVHEPSSTSPEESFTEVVWRKMDGVAGVLTAAVFMPVEERFFV